MGARTSMPTRNAAANLANASPRQSPIDVFGLAEGAGRRYYAGNRTGDNSSATGGQAASHPASTIAVGVSKMTANVGDVLILLPGHAETIVAAAGIDISKAGVTIMGLGHGTQKATITLGTATTATFKVSAANVRIVNVRFVGNIDSLVKMINIDTGADSIANVTFEDCEFVGSSTKEVLSFINIATTVDRVTLRRCNFYQPTDPAGSNGGADTGAIYAVDSENITVEDCVFDGFFETAVFHNRTTRMKYLTWRRNTVNQMLTDAARILLPTATSAVGSVGINIEPDTDYVPGRGYPVFRGTKVMPATTTESFFTVSGGQVQINSIAGQITTVMSATASNFKLNSNPTTGADIDICADLAIANLAAGILLGITGTLATAMQQGLAIVGQVTPVRVAAGTIDGITSGTNTGQTRWTLWWEPIDTTLGVPNVYAA